MFIISYYGYPISSLEIGLKGGKHKSLILNKQRGISTASKNEYIQGVAVQTRTKYWSMMSIRDQIEDCLMGSF